MSITRKLAIPAGIATAATAAIAPGAGTAEAATAPHDAAVTMLRQATAQAPARRARAIDILDHDPLDHAPLDHAPIGAIPDTTFKSHSNANGDIYFYIAGSYSYVSYASTEVTAYKTFTQAHIEIEKPNGTAWRNTNTFDAVAGGFYTYAGYPNIYSAGNWHAILWDYVDGKYINEVSTYIHAVAK